MRTTVFFLSCLLAPWAAPRAQEADLQKSFPYASHVETLDNGLKIIIVPMKSGGLVAYWSVVRTGSRDEFEPVGPLPASDGRVPAEGFFSGPEVGEPLPGMPSDSCR